MVSSSVQSDPQTIDIGFVSGHLKLSSASATKKGCLGEAQTDTEPSLLAVQSTQLDDAAP
jgi:hypothetical protein